MGLILVLAAGLRAVAGRAAAAAGWLSFPAGSPGRCQCFVCRHSGFNPGAGMGCALQEPRCFNLACRLQNLPETGIWLIPVLAHDCKLCFSKEDNESCSFSGSEAAKWGRMSLVLAFLGKTCASCPASLFPGVGVWVPFPWARPLRILLLQWTVHEKPSWLNIIPAFTWPLYGEDHYFPKRQEDGPRICSLKH